MWHYRRLPNLNNVEHWPFTVNAPPTVPTYFLTAVHYAYISSIIIFIIIMIHVYLNPCIYFLIIPIRVYKAEKNGLTRVHSENCVPSKAQQSVSSLVTYLFSASCWQVHQTYANFWSSGRSKCPEHANIAKHVLLSIVSAAADLLFCICIHLNLINSGFVFSQ